MTISLTSYNKQGNTELFILFFIFADELHERASASRLYGNPMENNSVFQKLNFTPFVRRNVKILGRRFYSSSLKDVAWLEDAQLIFLIFHTFVCKFDWVDAVQGQKNVDKCIN